MSDFLTEADIRRGEAAADQVLLTVRPERKGDDGTIWRYAGDGVGLRRQFRVVSAEIQVELPSAATREVKARIRKLPAEVDGFRVVVEPVASRCMLCGFKANTRREMQRHKCDA